MAFTPILAFTASMPEIQTHAREELCCSWLTHPGGLYLFDQTRKHLFGFLPIGLVRQRQERLLRQPRRNPQRISGTHLPNDRWPALQRFGVFPGTCEIMTSAIGGINLFSQQGANPNSPARSSQCPNHL